MGKEQLKAAADIDLATKLYDAKDLFSILALANNLAREQGLPFSSYLIRVAMASVDDEVLRSPANRLSANQKDFQ